MPLRRFAAYFIGISVCSTIAFASAAASRPAPQEAEAPAPVQRAVRLAPPGHAPHKPQLMATTD